MSSVGSPVTLLVPVLAFVVAAFATLALRQGEEAPASAARPAQGVVAVVSAPRLGDVPDLPAPLAAPPRRRSTKVAQPAQDRSAPAPVSTPAPAAAAPTPAPVAPAPAPTVARPAPTPAPTFDDSGSSPGFDDSGPGP